MKKNRTGNDSDRGRSGKPQRRGAGHRRAPENDVAATSESSISEPETEHPQAAGNGRDSASGVAGGADGTASDAGSAHQQQVHEPAAVAADDDSIETAEHADAVAELTAEVAELRNEMLRRQADFENSRKRLIRDKEEAIKFANDSLIVELIGVLDDLERAITSAENGRDFASLHSGIELIEKQLLGTLERKWGLTRFDSAGTPFDPERHEALATEPSTEYSEATVLEDYQSGYTLHGRVIRAARVRVATPTVEAPGTAATDGDAADRQSGPDGAG